MKIKLNNVRLAFPELFEPTQVSGQGAFKYRANFLIA
ncbi:ssDNA-binding protein, partial [Arsenophonus sp.]